MRVATDSEQIQAARAALIGTALTGAAELAHIESATSPTGESISPRPMREVLDDLAAIDAFDSAAKVEGGIVMRAAQIRRPHR